MKTPKPRKWKDTKTGRIYWRVRWNDTNGKEVSRVFGSLPEAEEQVRTIIKERKRHGRAAAVNSDEVAALAAWRKYATEESENAREVPTLHDVVRQAIDRLKAGGTSPVLGDLVDRFLDGKQREDVSARHLEALKNRLFRFISYFDKEEVSGAITTENVEKAMASMRRGGLSPQTVKGIRTAAHGLFQWALDRDMVAANPVTNTKAPKVRQGEVGTITPSQLRGLLNTALKEDPAAVPAIAVWALCGLRRAEICRLTYKDIDRKRKEVRVSAQVAKTGVVRFVPMPDALTTWLEASEAAGVAPLGKLVPGRDERRSEGLLNRWLRELRPAAGIKNWPHNALRHGFASHAAAKYDDFSKVAAWLGHARDPRLLVSRYRSLVTREDGESWFEVIPERMKRKAKKKATRRSRVSANR